MNSLKDLITIAAKEYAYCDHDVKSHLHSLAGRFLRELGKRLEVEDWSVRNNRGGIAVSGEITLHSDDLYVQVCSDHFGPGVQFMVRGCIGNEDFTGLTNRYVRMAGRSWEEVLDELDQTCRLARLEAQAAKEKQPAKR